MIPDQPNLSFRANQHDFWPVYEAIKRYYPLGIDKREDGIYFSYFGMKELERLIVDNIHNESAMNTKWKKAMQTLETEFHHKVVSTTYGQAPSFSAFIELEKSEIKDRIISKELHFTISVIGPFYTIYATDTTSLMEGDDQNDSNVIRNRYLQCHRSIISPHLDYAPLFTRIRELIEEEFLRYRFVPYTIHSTFLEGLSVRYQDNEKNRVYHALFNHLFYFDSPVAGDQYHYGFEQWQIDNPNVTNAWKIEAPNRGGR